MDGGLLQLIAKGAEDLPLINKPEITPFKKIYRRIGLFSLMDSEVLLDDLSFGKVKLSKIPKVGDLVSKVYLELSIPDFKVRCSKDKSFNETIFTDPNYNMKKSILEKLLQIEDLENLKIDDESIIQLSPNSLAKNILLASKNKFSKTTELSLDYQNNYQIISYLLQSNLKNEDLIIGDFLLRYLDSQNTLINSSQYLQENYNKVYEDLVEKYYKYLSSLNPEDYQLNNDILQELNNYLYNDILSGDLQYIKENLGNEPIQFLKDNLETELIILQNLIQFIFSKDNFNNGNLKNQITLPFIVYLYYESDNNNNLKYDLTDKKLVSSTFIKENIQKLQNYTNRDTPIIKIITKTFEKIKVECENYFESVGYQKILGNLPLQTLSILIAIEEIWKWQVFDFSNTTTENTNEYQIIPGPEILHLTQNVDGSSVNLNSYINELTFFKDLVKSKSEGLLTPIDVLDDTSKEYLFKKNMTIDFERKLNISSISAIDLKSLAEIINIVENQIKNVVPYQTATNNSSYLNRFSKDLSLILVYIMNLFKEDLIYKNIFKSNSSKTWINFVNETVNSKMYIKWYSEFTSRMDSSYVSPEVYLQETGEVGLRLEDKIPLSVLPNNLYNLTSDKIKGLIKRQTQRFNYIINLAESEASDNSYILTTLKKFKNLDLSVVFENNKYFLVVNDNITNIWYHHFNNEYILITKQKIINLIYKGIRNNKIYFLLNENIDLNSLTIEYLQVCINNNIRLGEHGGDDEDFESISRTQVTTNTTITQFQSETRYYFKFYYDKNNILIDLRVIPSELIMKNDYKISPSFTLENEIEHITSNIYYINQLDLPNFLENYNFTKEYYTYREYTETNSGLSGVVSVETLDNYYKYSYKHHETIIHKEVGSTQSLIYRLPYKINSQKYNNITISSENFYNNKRISIIGRFGNNFNFREKVDVDDDDTLRCYSEGIDFYDINLDFEKLNGITTISNNEEDQLAQINNILIGYYENKEKLFSKIVEANDIVNNNFFEKFIECLENIKEIGPIYEKIINNFLTMNNLTTEKLYFMLNDKLSDINYWSSQFKPENNSEYIRDFFNKENLSIKENFPEGVINNDDFNYGTLNKKFYIPYNYLNDRSTNYLDNFSRNFLQQLENIETNLNLINSYPKLSKSIQKKNEIEHIIKRNFSKVIEKNLYEFKTETSLNQDNKIYYKDNIVTLNENDLKCDVLLNDLDNDNNYELIKETDETYPVSFYDYGITVNNKIIFLGTNFSDNNNSYSLLKEDLLSSNLSYKEINVDYIIFDESNLISDIVNVVDNNLLILKSSDGELLPYGKIYPDFSNPYKYYRLSRRDKSLKENLIFENNLIEKYVVKDNFVYTENFTNTTLSINPIYHCNKLKLEYHNRSFNITSKALNLTSDLKLNKFDFVYIPDDNKWYMLDESSKIEREDLDFDECFIFRFISTTIRNQDLFEDDLFENVLYDFSNITLSNLILLCDDLDFVKIKDNQIMESERQRLKEGDILLEFIGKDTDDPPDGAHDIYDYNICQIIKKSDGILEIYPKIEFQERPRLIRNSLLNTTISKIVESKDVIIYGNTFTFQFFIKYNLYELNKIFYSNPWEYRERLPGDLYFKDNKLELSTEINSNNWIYKSVDRFVKFTKQTDKWYYLDNEYVSVGDYIFDKKEINLSNYKDNPNEYLHTGSVLARVIGRKGKFVLLDTYTDTDISGNTYLVKSYPIKIKPTIEERENKIYGDNNIIISKYDISPVNIGEKKYLINIENNMISINSGYDNRLKESISFSKSLIYPNQEILIDNKWNRIVDFSTMKLEKSLPNKTNSVLIIPEIKENVLISKYDNKLLVDSEYINSLEENSYIFCGLILFDNSLINNVTYCDNLFLEKIERNILTFKFNNKSIEEKFISLSTDVRITNIFININNRVLLEVIYDISEKKIYGVIPTIDKSFNLIKEKIDSHTHVYLINKPNSLSYYDDKEEERYLLSCSNVNNLILNNGKTDIYFYNREILLVLNDKGKYINVGDFRLIKHNLYYKDYEYYRLIKYPKQEIFIDEYESITLDFDSNVSKENEKYIIKLLSNPVNDLDDGKIYQIGERPGMMEIIKKDSEYYLSSDNEIMLNDKFYQNKKHKLFYLREKLELLNENILPKEKNYFHYRIGFEEIDDINTKTTKTMRILDYIFMFDFSTPENYNSEVILNTNFEYYFDDVNLPVLNIKKGLFVESSKETKQIEIPYSDYNFSDSNKYYRKDTNAKQADLLVYNESEGVRYPLMIKNELGVEEDNRLLYSKENYLLVKLVEEIDWKKYINLSNSIGVNLPDDNFYNLYTSESDYNNYNEIELNLEKKERQDKILEIVNNIYNLIPQWILINDFKNNPEDYLNIYLRGEYNLEYKNNRFYDLSGNVYLAENIPTYLKISEIDSTLYLEYIVKKDNTDDEYNFKLFERLLNETPSHELGLKLSNLVDFYVFWEKLKLGFPSLYSESDIYLSKTSVNLKLEQIYRSQILKLFNDEIVDGELVNNNYEIKNIFEYLVDLSSLPDISELYYVDFKERDIVFDDMELEYNVPKKDNSKLRLNKYLPNQHIDLYGKIKYEVVNSKYLGTQFKVVLPENSLPSVNYSILIDNDELNYSFDTDLIINYDDLSNVEYLKIKIQTPVRLLKGKYYLNNSVKDWLSDDTFISINGILEPLVMDELNIISPKPKSSIVTLIKQVKITSYTNLNKHYYEFELDKDFNNEPSFGYNVSPSDLELDDVKAIEYKIKGSVLYLTFDDKLESLNTLTQTFKVNYQKRTKVELSNILKTVQEFCDDNNMNVLNPLNLKVTDSSGEELGNYIYSVSLDNTNLYNTEKVYCVKNNNLELVGKLIGDNTNGYFLISVDKLHNEESYTDLSELILLNSDERILISDLKYLMKNNLIINDSSLSFMDLVYNDFNFNIFDLYLEEELVKEIIDNQTFRDIENNYNNLSENKNLEIYTTETVEESPKFKEEFYYDILKSMYVLLKNTEIERFDNKMYRDYIHYFVEREKQDLYKKLGENTKRIIIPLPFWFCRNWNNSLPIIASNESDFYIGLEFNGIERVLDNLNILNNTKINGKLVYKTIWLGDEEKEMIGKYKQDYLIETFTKSQEENIFKREQEITLNLKGAVKDFFFSFYLDNNNVNSLVESELIDNKLIKYNGLGESDKNDLKELVDMEDFEELYKSLLDFYVKYCGDKYYVGFLISELLILKPTMTKNSINGNLAIYFRDFYNKKKESVYYPLSSCSLDLNGYQHIRDKSELFWSAKNQLNYENSGDMGRYGLSYSLFPLSNQPSGHINHNLVDSNLKLKLNEDYFVKAKKGGHFIDMHIWYRKYRLLRFMGNQAGVLW